MPRTQVIFFKEEDGTVPLIGWLDALPRKAQAKCVAALRRLELQGHELRRPQADYLEDDIYELRVGFGHLNYRMLYFFHSRTAAVVSHGLVKERVVPPKEIKMATRRMYRFKATPAKHTFILGQHYYAKP